MLKVRVIPTLLWKGPGLVKGIGFDSWRRIGTVMPAIKVYNARDVDELILLDISATGENRIPDLDAINELASECFVPLTVGGGVHDINTVRNLLRAGADKVAINTAAYEYPDFIRAASNLFGAQCVVCAIDAKRWSDGREGYEVFLHGGRTPTGIDVVEWATRASKLGAGEILLTSMDRDGTKEGFDLDLTRRVSDAVGVPVIASGGVGTLDHLVDGVVQGGADAVLAASIFHFGEFTVAQAKQRMLDAGIIVRPAS